MSKPQEDLFITQEKLPFPSRPTSEEDKNSNVNKKKRGANNLNSNVKLDIINYLIENEPKISDIERISEELENAKLKQSIIYNNQQVLISKNKKILEGLNIQIEKEMTNRPIYNNIQFFTSKLDNELKTLEQRLEIAEDDYYKLKSVLSNEITRLNRFKKNQHSLSIEVERGNAKLHSLKIVKTEFNTNLNNELKLLNKYIVYNTAIDDQFNNEKVTKQEKLDTLTDQFKSAKEVIKNKQEKIEELKNKQNRLRNKIKLEERYIHNIKFSINISKKYILHNQVHFQKVLCFFDSEDLNEIIEKYKNMLLYYHNNKFVFEMGNHELNKLNNEYRLNCIEYTRLREMNKTKNSKVESTIPNDNDEIISIKKTINVIKENNQRHLEFILASETCLKKLFEYIEKYKNAIKLKNDNFLIQSIDRVYNSNNISYSFNNSSQKQYSTQTKKKNIKFNNSHSIIGKSNFNNTNLKYSIFNSLSKKPRHNTLEIKTLISQETNEIEVNYLLYLHSLNSNNIQILIKLIGKFLFDMFKYLESKIVIKDKFKSIVYHSLSSKKTSNILLTSSFDEDNFIAKPLTTKKSTKINMSLVNSNYESPRRMHTITHSLSNNNLNPQQGTINMKQRFSLSKEIKNKDFIVSYISKFIMKKRKTETFSSSNNKLTSIKKRKLTNYSSQPSLKALIYSESPLTTENKLNQDNQVLEDSYVISRQKIKEEDQTKQLLKENKQKINSTIIAMFQIESNNQNNWVKKDKDGLELDIFNFSKKNRVVFNNAKMKNRLVLNQNNNKLKAISGIYSNKKELYPSYQNTVISKKDSGISFMNQNIHDKDTHYNHQAHTSRVLKKLDSYNELKPNGNYKSSDKRLNTISKAKSSLKNSLKNDEEDSKDSAYSGVSLSNLVALKSIDQSTIKGNSSQAKKLIFCESSPAFPVISVIKPFKNTVLSTKKSNIEKMKLNCVKSIFEFNKDFYTIDNILLTRSSNKINK